MISLSTLLPNIPDNKRRELEIVTQRIIDSGLAEIIQLFGSYARGDFKPETDPRQPHKSDFDVLVITLDDESKRKFERMFGSGIHAFEDIETVVQLIVEPIERVNLKLHSNHFFYIDIKNEGKTLYDSDRARLSKPFPISNRQRRENAEKHLQYFIQEVKAFIDFAEYGVSKKDYRKSAFMYQQAAESAYKGVEIVFTEYQPYEHYLEVLRERASECDGRINGPFPTTTREEEFLFKHLALAYIGGRYISDENYSVTQEQIEYWSEELGKLLEVMEQVCKEKIEKLKAVE